MTLPKRPAILPMQTTGGRGSVHGNSKTIMQLRQMLLEVAEPKEIRQVYRVLLDMAKNGSMAAIRELLDRLFGKASTGMFNTLVDNEMANLVDLQDMTAEELQVFKQAPGILARKQQMIIDQDATEGEDG